MVTCLGILETSLSAVNTGREGEKEIGWKQGCQGSGMSEGGCQGCQTLREK